MRNNRKTASNKRKTATITFQQAVNYGALLQQYALQRAINKLGYDNEVLNYDCPAIKQAYQVVAVSQVLSIKKLINMLLHSYIGWFRQYKFKKFIEQNIKWSPLLEKRVLPEIENEYSLFITGSDQVWNYKLTQSDGAFFLDFVKAGNKKFSYAASFGIDEIPEDKNDMYRKYLKDFNLISVREVTGAKLVEKLTGAAVFVDLDPVFLLSITEWQELCSGFVAGKYILVYTVGSPVHSYQYAQNLSRKTGLKIINVKYRMSLRNQMENIGRCLYTVGPAEFVNLIGNAEYVVTNSFHATAFSIIFNKKFYVEVPAGLGSRITDLLSDLELGDRAFMKPALTEDNPIEWATINARLHQRREESLQHLHQIVEAADE